MSQLPTANLYYREGGSDKVYIVAIEQEGSGYVVNFEYGRRGNTLITGTKTNSPVPYNKALTIFGKLVNEKMGKGYKEVNNGRVTTIANPITARETGAKPMLLNEIDEEDVEKYINDPDWCAQEKYDGVRRMLIKKESDIAGTNRKGLTIAISKEIIQQLQNASSVQNCILDGEAIGDSVIIFDYPIPEMSFKSRYEILKDDFRFDGEILKLAPVAWTTQEKKDLLKRLKEDNAEGIVFKNIHSEYVAGRPNSGGDHLKFKFVATASCIVMKINDTTRSVLLGVFIGGRCTEVGNVTVYPNQDIPTVGDVVEIKYLYWYPNGSLFQPVLLGKRDDINHDECQVEQLKAKREEAAL